LSTSSDDTPIQNAIHEIALDYLDKGWNPLPIPYRKKERPPVGFTGANGRLVTRDDIEEWTRHSNWGNIAVRLPRDVIGIDVDHYGDHCGGDRIEEAERRLGGLPSTYASTSRPHTASSIWFYRVPPLSGGQRWKADPFPHVQIIQFGHRYAIVEPSVHPTTERLYRWYDPTGEPIDAPPSVDDLTELPWAWIQELLESSPDNQTKTTTPSATKSGGNTTDRHGAVQRVLDKWNDSKHGGRHDAATRATLALVRLDDQRYPGADTALREVIDDFISLVTSDGSRTITEAQDEIRRMFEGAERKVQTTPTTIPAYDPNQEWMPDLDWITGDQDEPDAPPSPSMPSNINLPDDFWDRRPSLATIRDAARSTMTSPDAVLGVTLARVATLVPPEVHLPNTGASRSLNIAVALVGRPGQGKSSANQVGRELVPWPTRESYENTVGTGEGFIEAYLETSRDNGKVVKSMVKKSNLFYIDEGKSLLEIGSRKGATIMETIRSAISGETLGQRNATAETSRRLDANTYRAAIIIGLQPRIALDLLNDSHGGTPQRFVWFHAGDPNAPKPHDRPEWPGALDVGQIINKILRGSLLPTRLTIDKPIRDKIEHESWQNLTGECVISEEESHSVLARLKIASLLAVLECRSHVDHEDWELAGLIVENSHRLRTWLRKDAAMDAKRREQETTLRAVRREQTVETAREQRALVGSASTIARYCHKHPGRNFARRELQTRPKSEWRRHATIDEALEYALDKKWIERRGDEYAAGSATPSKALS